MYTNMAKINVKENKTPEKEIKSCNVAYAYNVLASDCLQTGVHDSR